MSHFFLVHLVFAEQTFFRTSGNAESDSDAGDNPAEVKTSNSTSEEETEKAAAVPTPSKCISKAQPKYVIHATFWQRE